MTCEWGDPLEKVSEVIGHPLVNLIEVLEVIGHPLVNLIEGSEVIGNPLKNLFQRVEGSWEPIDHVPMGIASVDNLYIHFYKACLTKKQPFCNTSEELLI